MRIRSLGLLAIITTLVLLAPNERVSLADGGDGAVSATFSIKEPLVVVETTITASQGELNTLEVALETLTDDVLQLTGEALEVVPGVAPESTLTVALPLSGASEGPITGDINFILGNLEVATLDGQTTATIQFDSALTIVGTASLDGTVDGGIELNISDPQLLLQPPDPDVSLLPGGDPTVTDIGASFVVDLTNLPDGASLDVSFSKDTATLLSEPGSKFLLLADSVDAQLGDLTNDVAFGISVVKTGFGTGDLGDTEVTLEVSKLWFEERISEGKRIFIGKFNDAGEPVPPPQDVTDTCTTATDPVICTVTLTGDQGGLSVFALAAFAVIPPGGVTEEVTVELHTIDQFTKTGASKTPVNGAEVKVFDRDLLNGLEITLLDAITTVFLTKNPDGSLYPDIFESAEAEAAQVSSCTTGADGHAICVESGPGNYLVLVEFVDVDGRKVILGRPKSLEEFVDGDGDGNIDLINHTGICFDASQNPLLDTNGDWTDNDCDGVLDTGVTKEFQIIKVIKKKTDEFGQPIVELGRGSKRVVVGSYLEIIYPEFAIWEEGVTSYLYPFILTSDSEWTVDICAEVAAGYNIVGVYDAFGNLFATTECVHSVVANTKLVVAFEVVDLASPPPRVTATFTVRGHRGKVHNFGLITRGHRKGKDTSISLRKPKAKFRTLADSVGGRIGDLANDVAFRINVDQTGIVTVRTGGNEVALEVSRVWFDTKIEEGKRILIAVFNYAGEPILPPQDVTGTCTSSTNPVVCTITVTQGHGSLSVFALSGIPRKNTPPPTGAPNSVNSPEEESAAPELARIAPVQPAAAPQPVFSQTKARIFAYEETHIQTPDGQVELIVPAGFFKPDAVNKNVELELKNLDPATFAIPDNVGQLVRAAEVNHTVEGEDGSVEPGALAVLVIPLTPQDIALVHDDPTKLTIHQLDSATGTWKPLPTTFTVSPTGPRLTAKLDEFNHTMIGVFQTISPQRTLGPSFEIEEPTKVPVVPASKDDTFTRWSLWAVIGLGVGGIAIMLALAASFLPMRHRA